MLLEMDFFKRSAAGLKLETEQKQRRRKTVVKMEHEKGDLEMSPEGNVFDVF